MHRNMQSGLSAGLVGMIAVCSACDSPMGAVLGYQLGTAFPSLCPDPVVQREETAVEGLGTIVRLKPSTAFDSLFLSLNNHNEIAANSFVSTGIAATCYAAVDFGDDVSLLAENAWVRDLSDTGLGVGDGPSGAAAAFQQGSVTELPCLPNRRMKAFAVNDAADMIVGTADGGEDAELAIWNWNNGAWTLTLPGVSRARPLDVNALGQVVGWIEEDRPGHEGEPLRRPFLWHSGSMVMLPLLPGTNTVQSPGPGMRINVLGTIVGTLSAECADGESVARAVVWDGPNVIELEGLGGDSSGANSINADGQIVGWSRTAEGSLHACLWEDRVPRDLNDLLSSALGITLEVALAINDNGVILAIGADAPDLVLIKPLPEGG